MSIFSVRVGYVSLIRLHVINNTQICTYISIPEFYKGKSVLVTGGTGFLGQGLIEKLLRSCPDIGNIYVPIKPNKQGNTEERYQQLLQYKVFNKLWMDDPNFGRKIIPFNGDLTLDNMGLSGDLYNQMLEDVSVIFHSAALIKLNPSLRDSVMANVYGARNVFRFGKKCRNLCAYIHVSSLYTNMHLPHIEEKLYTAKRSPNELIETVLDKEPLQGKDETSMLESSPMVYIYSKRVAESIIKEEGTDKPVGVFRPAFVSPALKEPYPNWVFGMAGFCGILQNSHEGLISHVGGNPDSSVELVPVDMVVNSLINMGWYLGSGRHGQGGKLDPLVVHVHSSTDNIIVLKDLLKIVNDKPSGQSGRELKVVTNRYIQAFVFATQYLIPAILKDFLLKLSGEKAKHTRMQLRLLKGLKYLEITSLQNPTKDFHNAKMMHSQLSDSDKQVFPFDIQGIKWKDFIHSWMGSFPKPTAKVEDQGTVSNLKRPSKTPITNPYKL